MRTIKTRAHVVRTADFRARTPYFPPLRLRTNIITHDVDPPPTDGCAISVHLGRHTSLALQYDRESVFTNSAAFKGACAPSRVPWIQCQYTHAGNTNEDGRNAPNWWQLSKGERVHPERNKEQGHWLHLLEPYSVGHTYYDSYLFFFSIYRLRSTVSTVSFSVSKHYVILVVNIYASLYYTLSRYVFRIWVEEVRDKSVAYLAFVFLIRLKDGRRLPVRIRNKYVRAKTQNTLNVMYTIMNPKFRQRWL